MLDGHLKGTSRTKRVASPRTLIKDDWTDERLEALEGMLDLFYGVVYLAYFKPEFQMLMFPDASDLFVESCVT